MFVLYPVALSSRLERAAWRWGVSPPSCLGACRTVWRQSPCTSPAYTGATRSPYTVFTCLLFTWVDRTCWSWKRSINLTTTIPQIFMMFWGRRKGEGAQGPCPPPPLSKVGGDKVSFLSILLPDYLDSKPAWGTQIRSYSGNVQPGSARKVTPLDSMCTPPSLLVHFALPRLVKTFLRPWVWDSVLHPWFL